MKTIVDYSPDLNDMAALLVELNHRIHKTWVADPDNCPYFHMKTNGDSVIVEFLGVIVFGEDWDGREHDESTDTYEPMASYLRRKADDIIHDLQDIIF